MKHYSRRALLVNLFGAFGYVSCLLLWGWTGVIYLPLILANDSIKNLLLPAESDTTPVQPSSLESSPLLIAIAVAVTIIVLIVTIIVLLRSPITIAKTGKTVTTKAANTAMPLITHGKAISPARKRKLTSQLVKLAKLLLILVPFGLLLPGFYLELPLPYELVILMSCLLALLSVFWFSLQYIFARLLSVKLSRLV